MHASRFVLAFALLAAPLALPTLALARDGADDEVVSTASRITAKPPTEADVAKAQADAKAKAEADRVAKPVSTQDQVAAWLADAPPIERVDGPLDYAAPPEVDVNGYALGPDGKRQVHGEAGVSVGTGGYRSGYVSTLIPIGEASTLGVAFSQTDYGKSGRGYGYGYGGYGYGYGYGGRGGGYDGLGGYGDYGWGPRGGRSQSLALSLDMRGGGRSRSDTPEGCAPGFRDGDRYVEPVWVTQMRGDKACDAAAEKH